MTTAMQSTVYGLGAAAAALLGAVFFFAIIGVFGLALAIASWAVFVVLAILIARRPQPASRAP